MTASYPLKTKTAAAQKRTGYFRRKGWFKPYLMVLPAMAGLALFYLYPVGNLILLSFYKYNVLNQALSRFIGLQNYRMLLADPVFGKVLLNTAVYTAAVVLVTTLIAIPAAVWICRDTGMNRLMQAGLFTPHIISAVTISLVWMWMMAPDQGLLNYLLRLLGLPAVPWLTSSRTALLSVIIVSVWKSVGYYILIIVAALQSIPPDILEAARLDGAGGIRLLVRITLPLISPQLFFILITQTIASFKVFENVQIMTGGGPNNSTNTLVYYLYQYRSTRIGYASAVGVFLMILVGVVTLIYFRFFAKKVFYQ